MNSLNYITDDSLNKINSVLNNYESFLSESNQKFSNKQNFGLNSEKRKISRNLEDQSQKINLKTESCCQTSSQNKRYTIKLKNKLTPFQKFLNQKEENKVMNNIKNLRYNNFLKDFYNISNKKKNKNPNLVNVLYYTPYINDNDTIDNNDCSKINNRFTPTEYFNKIKNYKNNIVNYNSVKLDLYNSSLNQRIGYNLKSKNLKNMYSNNDINNCSEITKTMKAFSTKNKIINKSMAQGGKLMNFDFDLNKNNDKRQYNNRNHSNKTNLIFFGCSNLIIPKKKKYNIKLTLSYDKSKNLGSRIDAINKSANYFNNENSSERRSKINFF